MGAANVIWQALNAVLPALKSNASIEAKIVDAVGSVADVAALERQNTLDTINEALANQRITTIEYYRRKAIAFQKDSTLIYDTVNQGAYYEVIDTEKQIIKQAYIIDVWPNYLLAVNAVDAQGHLRVLTSDELASFTSYMSEFQPLGLTLTCTSLKPAVVTDAGIIVYIQSGADAVKVASDINAAFIAAESVLRSSNKLSLTEISDTIQTVAGVKAVAFSDIKATEQLIDGSTTTVRPVNGLFDLTTSAYTFGTTITEANLKILY